MFRAFEKVGIYIYLGGDSGVSESCDHLTGRGKPYNPQGELKEDKRFAKPLRSRAEGSGTNSYSQPVISHIFISCV